MEPTAALIRLYNRPKEAAVNAELLKKFMPRDSEVFVAYNGEVPDVLDFPHVSCLRQVTGGTPQVWKGDGTYNYEAHIAGDGETIKTGLELCVEAGYTHVLIVCADTWILGPAFIRRGFELLNDYDWVSSRWTGDDLGYDFAFVNARFALKNRVIPGGRGVESMPRHYGVNIAEKWLKNRLAEVSARVKVLEEIWPIHPENTPGYGRLEDWQYVEHQAGDWKRRGYFPEVPMVTYHAAKIGMEEKKRLANQCAGAEIFPTAES